MAAAVPPLEAGALALVVAATSGNTAAALAVQPAAATLRGRLLAGGLDGDQGAVPE